MKYIILHTVYYVFRLSTATSIPSQGDTYDPGNTRRSPNAGSMLGQRWVGVSCLLDVAVSVCPVGDTTWTGI